MVLVGGVASAGRLGEVGVGAGFSEVLVSLSISSLSLSATQQSLHHPVKGYTADWC